MMSEQPVDAYELLSAPMPREAIQRTKSQETKKGYDTTGIGYQFVVNRFNEALGPENWAFSWLIQREAEGEFASGRPRWEICVRISIKISVNGNWLEPRSCVGGHVSTTYDDALKGAITNGFKKAAAFWGVAREAYEGTIDPDSVSQEEGAISPVAQDTVEEAVSPPPRPPPQPQPAAQAPTTDEPKVSEGDKSTQVKLAAWCEVHFPNDIDKQKRLIKAVGSFRNKDGEVVEGPDSIKNLKGKWLKATWGKASKIDDTGDAERLVAYAVYDDWKASLEGGDDVPM
ncbi:hypothetical protein LCGC14_1877660 [marine sediment metagenome]|uniref:Rad52/22 double-strand break repair protein n=1 Tax=marine sediment metagenome TaxID=412755 RepID=A0A0F9G345_9ZZZZ